MTTERHDKKNMFLIGGTGNGKTESVTQIVKLLDIPYVIEDMTNYTQEGYVGDSINAAFERLISAANGDINKAQRGIVVFDEIDKKLPNEEKSGVATTAVLNGLLKKLEGTTIHTSKGTINTDFITFILIGACERVFDIRKRRISGKGIIGFSSNDDNDFKNNEMLNRNFIPHDFIEAGFGEEFVGRIPVIIEFNIMDYDMALKIINESKISSFSSRINELSKFNTNIEMNKDEIVSEIAKRAVRLKIGVRGINYVVEYMFKSIFEELMFNKNIDVKKAKKCLIDKNLIYDNTSFKLCQN